MNYPWLLVNFEIGAAIGISMRARLGKQIMNRIAEEIAAKMEDI